MKRYRNLGVALFVLAAVAMWARLEGQREFVDLYVNELALEEIPILSSTLRRAGLEHRVDARGRSLEVLREDRVLAKQTLIRAGLPKLVGRLVEHPSLPDPGKTVAETRAHYKRALRDECREVLNGLPQVEDSGATFTVPDKSYVPPPDYQTGRVFLKLSPNAELSDSTLQAIVTNTSLSCPELEPQHVAVIDSSGQNINPLSK